MIFCIPAFSATAQNAFTDASVDNKPGLAYLKPAQAFDAFPKKGIPGFRPSGRCRTLLESSSSLFNKCYMVAGESKKAVADSSKFVSGSAALILKFNQ